TQRAVAILARYQGVLQSPAEQPLRASVEKVVRVFQSELFQALLDIQECYELSVLPARQQDGPASLGSGPPARSHEAADPAGREGQQPLQGRAMGTPEAEAVPQLVRVTQSRTEPSARVCGLVVVGASSVLPK
ncbi:disks large homolog 1-like, partial [Pseudonaja textilis]|uniref:disks large homolog 1-like n=1 Tax=Pseudonaja textilis TaxID=8673 RepID=UPI000EA8E1C7